MDSTRWARKGARMDRDKDGYYYQVDKEGGKDG
jgi:hypothetical protein